MNWPSALLILLILGLSTVGAAEEHGLWVMEPDEIRVIDGDTIAWRDERIRLWGIDAPEMNQSCAGADGVGEVSKEALSSIIRGSIDVILCHAVVKDGRFRDLYGRAVATCRVNGQDVGELMVWSGWARDYWFFSDRQYEMFERFARDDARGMWLYGCEAPWEWRARR